MGELVSENSEWVSELINKKADDLVTEWLEKLVSESDSEWKEMNDPVN